MDNDALITTILFIGAVAIVGIVIMFIAGNLHAYGVTDETDSFTVTDPNSEKVCGLQYTPEGVPTVQYYNGTAWSTLTLTTDFTVSGDTVTVKASAMD